MLLLEVSEYKSVWWARARVSECESTIACLCAWLLCASTYMCRCIYVSWLCLNFFSEFEWTSTTNHSTFCCGTAELHVCRCPYMNVCLHVWVLYSFIFFFCSLCAMWCLLVAYMNIFITEIFQHFAVASVRHLGCCCLLYFSISSFSHALYSIHLFNAHCKHVCAPVVCWRNFRWNGIFIHIYTCAALIQSIWHCSFRLCSPFIFLFVATRFLKHLNCHIYSSLILFCFFFYLSFSLNKHMRYRQKEYKDNQVEITLTEDWWLRLRDDSLLRFKHNELIQSSNLSSVQPPTVVDFTDTDCMKIVSQV